MNTSRNFILPLTALIVCGGAVVVFIFMTRPRTQVELVRTTETAQATPVVVAEAPPASAPPLRQPAPPWPALWALDLEVHAAYEEAKGHSSEGLRLALPKLDAALRRVIADPAQSLQGGDKGWVTRRQQDLATRGEFLADFAAIGDEELFLKFEDIVVVVEIMMSAADDKHVPVVGGHSHSKPTTPDEIAAAAAHAAECPLD